MADELLGIADNYIKAWNRKDADGIAQLLSPDVHFVGAMAETDGRDLYVEAVRRMFPILKGIEVRSKFASGSEVMLAYDFNCSEPIGKCRTAELLTFRNGLITRSEIFFDARPFEKLRQGAQ
jgi:hypothetical protein